MKTGPVTLRTWREDDVALLADLRNDAALQALLLARARGSSPEQVRRWLSARSEADDCLFFIVAERVSDDCVGYLQIAGIDWIDRRGDLGVCIAPAHQGAGFGTAAIELAVAQASRTWGLRKISLRVRADNARAIECYERFGFCKCGQQERHVFIDGAWQDVLLMDLFLQPSALA